MRPSRLYISIVIGLVLSSVAIGRIWRDKSGKQSTEAEFVGVSDGKVRLRKPTGKEIDVPIEKLSNEDQAYIARILVQGKGAKAPEAKDEKAIADGGENAANPPRAVEKKQPEFEIFVESPFASALELERAAKACRRAADALELYDVFMKDPGVAADEKNFARERFEFWKDAAKKGFVRFGTKWVPPEDREKGRIQAKQFVKDAWDLIAVGSNDAARDKLLEASRTDPEAIEADFTLGLLNALVARHAPTAEKHFEQCVLRMPKHVSALNNLALAEVRLKKYTEALRHWRTGLQIAPGTMEITHNVGRLLRYANRSIVSLPKNVEKELNELYANAASLPDDRKSDRNVGWLYMRLFIVDEPGDEGDDAEGDAEREVPEEGDTPKAPDDARRIVVATGSGFVVDRGIVVTNRHVADGADGFKLIHPVTRQRLPAVAISVSRTKDLALLKCPDLDIPSLKLADSLPRLGTEIMVLGFPGDALGTTLKATRGTITSLPSPPRNPYCFLDAIANPGNSGGPVCDENGTVVGVLTAGTLQHRQNYTLAVPSTDLVEFVTGRVEGISIGKPVEAAAMKWPDVAELASQSTVLIMVERDAVNISVQGPQPKPVTPEAKSEPYEDSWCILCNGSGVRECARSGCALGKVLVPHTRLVARNPITGAPIYQTTYVRERCPTCGGRGNLRCPLCVNGVERNR